MSTPLRILQICHKPPRPSVDGGCLAMDSLTQGLMMEGHRVKVMTLHTHKHPYKPKALGEDYVLATRFQAVFADTALSFRDAATHMVAGESYHLNRFHVPEMDRAIEECLRAEVFDVILLESLFVSSYLPAIRRLSDAEVILRAHNVEHQLWAEVAQNMDKGPKRWLLKLFQTKLKDQEIQIAGQVDGIVAISAHDAEWFQGTLVDLHPNEVHRVAHVPFGLDVEQTLHTAMGTPPHRVLHLGAMDWSPNLQGVTWLKDEVWPMVRQTCPDATLALAGRNMPEDWESLPGQGIDILGEVDNAQATYDTPSIVVVPLHAGSGMRIKIAEALAAGRPLVTTTKGMEGLDLTHRKEVIVANSSEDMAEAIAHLLQHPQEALDMGAQGREWALRHLGHQARAQAWTSFLHQAVKA